MLLIEWTITKDNDYQKKMYILEFIYEINGCEIRNRPYPGGFVPRIGYDNHKLIKDYIKECLKYVNIKGLTIDMLYDLLFDLTGLKDIKINKIDINNFIKEQELIHEKLKNE